MKSRNELINGLVELGSRLRTDDMKFLSEVAEALKAVPDVPETLRWVADELDARAEEVRQDWVKVLLTVGARARISVLTEIGKMCRKAAVRVEGGGKLRSLG